MPPRYLAVHVGVVNLGAEGNLRSKRVSIAAFLGPQCSPFLRRLKRVVRWKSDIEHEEAAGIRRLLRAQHGGLPVEEVAAALGGAGAAAGGRVLRQVRQLLGNSLARALRKRQKHARQAAAAQNDTILARRCLVSSDTACASRAHHGVSDGGAQRRVRSPRQRRRHGVAWKVPITALFPRLPARCKPARAPPPPRARSRSGAAPGAGRAAGPGRHAVL